MARPDDTSDDALGATPIPTQLVSNGEFIPLPQSRRQRQVEFLITQMADDRAARLGPTRRRFLQSKAGMAVAFTALNAVYGCSDGEGGGALPSTTSSTSSNPVEATPAQCQCERT